jgi:serine/threonine protein kinase
VTLVDQRPVEARDLGMGSVYLAEDERMRRRIALKVIVPELARDKGFRRRFEASS